MKKRLTIIAVLMMLCSTMFGQNESHWGNVVGCEHTMEYRGIVQIYGVNQPSSELEVAAFCNDELRGKTYTQVLGTGCIFYISIGSNISNQLITFKLYDPNSEKEYSTDTELRFRPNATASGYPVVNFYETYWDKQNIEMYSEDMTVLTEIQIDGVPQDCLNLEVAAFCGDELRGIGRPIYNEQTQKYTTEIRIYGEVGKTPETISFKLFKFDGEMESPITTDYTVTFESGMTMQTPVTVNFLNNPVAMINNKSYSTLAAALTDVTAESNTITVLKDIEEAGLVIDKDVTIDFNNFTYSFTEPTEGTYGFQITDGTKVTLKNGTLQVAEGYDDKYNVLVENCADQLILEVMKLIGAGLNDELSYVLSNNNGETNIYNTTISANDAEEGTHFAFDVCRTEFDVPGVILRDDVIINGKAELNQGNIFGNTKGNDLEIVAYKSFKAAPGEGTIGWGTISTPIENGSLISESLPVTTNPHDLYLYDEPTGMWRYYATHNTLYFTPGQGYLYANKEDITAKFEGKMNYASASMSVSYTEEAGDFKGFNLIGNPFASYITLNDIVPAGGSISIVNSGFYSIDSETGGYIAKKSTDQISTMEAVMIQIEPASRANSFEAELIFTQPNPSDAKRSENVNASLAVSVSNDDYNDVAYVSFGEGLGLNKIEHLNNDVPMVYLPVDGENFAIATMSQDVTMIPVSFKAATMGEYTIAVEAQNCEYSTMTLVDRFTGVETNLLLEDYSFIAKSNDSADRFFIRLDNSQQTTDNSNFAYINNGMINIDVEGQAMINVYDVTGRSVAEYNVFESASISTSDFANGMYIIRMSDENGVKVQKVVIE